MKFPGYAYDFEAREVDRHIDINVKGVIFGTQVTVILLWLLLLLLLWLLVLLLLFFVYMPTLTCRHRLSARCATHEAKQGWPHREHGFVMILTHPIVYVTMYDNNASNKQHQQ